MILTKFDQCISDNLDSDSDFFVVQNLYWGIITIIIILLSNHRVEIHFALWRLHKTQYLSHIVMQVYSKIKHVNM